MSNTAAGAQAPSAAAQSGASGSSFYLAMRVLPKKQREGMYAVYSFCRAVDDIADGDLPLETKRKSLEAWRHAIERMDAGGTAPPELRPLAGYGLRKADFLAVIDGMEMDADGPLRAPDDITLDLYCERVASAVGRLSNRVFGLSPEIGDPLAHHLGRALQLTNILRDLDEDCALGRLYLSRDVLEDAGVAIGERPIAEILADPRVDAAARTLAMRAQRHFEEANALMDRAPRGQVRAPRLMYAAYSDILARLLQTGWQAPRRRVGTSKPRVLLALLRYGIV